jgi:hypothetical protein
MAVLKLLDGKDMAVSAEEGRIYWEILNNQREPTEQQEKVALDIKRIYLNWHNAPDDYIRERHVILRAMVRNTPASAELEQKILDIKERGNG